MPDARCGDHGARGLRRTAACVLALFVLSGMLLPMERRLTTGVDGADFRVDPRWRWQYRWVWQPREVSVHRASRIVVERVNYAVNWPVVLIEQLGIIVAGGAICAWVAYRERRSGTA